MSEQAAAPSQSAPSTPSESSNVGSQQGSVGTSNVGSQSKPSTSDLFEITVNGKPKTVTREEAISYAQKGYAAHETWEQASKTHKEVTQIRNQVEKIISTAKSNPIEALLDPALGLSKDQIREAFEKWYTQEYIEPETLSPDQRKLREAEMRLKKYEETEAQKKKQEEDEQQAQLTNQQRDYLSNKIIEAIESSGLPKTKFFAQRMAFYMRQNLLNGWEAPIDMVVSQVKKEYREGMGNISKDSTAQQLIEMFGEDVINKIRKHDLEQLRSRRQNPSIQSGGSNNPLAPTSDEPVSYSEVNRRLREMREGKR